MNTVSLEEYAKALKDNGINVISGTHNILWGQDESFSVARFPTFSTIPPDVSEIKQVFKHRGIFVCSYIIEPDDVHTANAVIYLCDSSSYSCNKLSGHALRDIRYALKNLRIETIDWETFFKHAFDAFRDTRFRVGLSDGTQKCFRQRFWPISKNPAYRIIGAWKGDILVAFIVLVVVNDFVEIDGVFSTNLHRSMCPNDALINYTLDHFLVQQKLRVVSFGLSSIQSKVINTGLHDFKIKVGFNAKPVYRVFVFHPFLRPPICRPILACVQWLLKLKPNNRKLRKAFGVLSLCLNKKK